MSARKGLLNVGHVNCNGSSMNAARVHAEHLLREGVVDRRKQRLRRRARADNALLQGLRLQAHTGGFHGSCTSPL